MAAASAHGSMRAQPRGGSAVSPMGLALGGGLVALVLQRVLVPMPMEDSAWEAPDSLDSLGRSSEPNPVDLLLRQLDSDADSGPEREFALRLSAGHLLREQGSYAAATAQYDAAASVARFRREQVEALIGHAKALTRQGRLFDATDLLEDALEGQERGEFAVDVLHQLANVKREAGSLDAAIELYEQAWGLATQRDEASQAMLAADQAEAHRLAGDLPMAFFWLETAVRAQRLYQGRLGLPEEWDAQEGARISSRRASAHQQGGDVERAVKLYRQATRLQARLLHPSHEDLIASKISMGRLQCDLGNIQDGLDLIEDVERVLMSRATESTDLSRALIVKAELLQQAKRFDEAEAALDRAAEWQRRTYGDEMLPEVAWALRTKGDLLRAQGKPGEANAKYHEALVMHLATVGGKHPETASTYARIGAVFEDAGDLAEAEKNFRRCLDISAHACDSPGPATAIDH